MRRVDDPTLLGYPNGDQSAAVELYQREVERFMWFIEGRECGEALQ